MIEDTTLIRSDVAEVNTEVETTKQVIFMSSIGVISMQEQVVMSVPAHQTIGTGMASRGM